MRTITSLLSCVPLIGGAAGTAVLLASPNAEAAPCYIAYIHGSGEQHQDDTDHEGFDPAAKAIESEWTPDGNNNSFTYYSSKAWAGADSCAIYRIGYDGKRAWNDELVTGQVSAELNDFINEYNIPDNGLIIVTHSMGGVVGRFILDNGTPNSPYPDALFTRIAQKTKYMITMQAPHAGTQTADAIYGEADHYFSEAAGAIAHWFAGQDQTPARNSLRRSFMADAADWMGDEARDKTIYTVGGNSVDDDAGEGMEDDGLLQTAWAGVCYRRAWFNLEGAACSDTCVIVPITCQVTGFTFDETAGDGLVELISAHGQLGLGGGWRGPARFMAGAYRKWLDIHDNHNQGRYDKHNAPITDYISGATQSNWPGSYIATYGLNLPCSTVACEARSGAGHL